MTHAPHIGDRIAERYDLEEIVGTGGMSTVFCAYDTQLERRVAIKILHERFSEDEEYVARFRHEARAVAQLAHPNIVTVIDRGEDEGRQYIVFEFVDGENLKDVIVRSGAAPVRRAVEIAIAVADGLSFAHDHGLVHRDVKPQNILLSRDGGPVKVTDFGIARSLDVEHGVTQTGTVVGTGEYLAPEQANGGVVSPASDVYSLGVVLWEMLAGRVPFQGDSFVAVALRHVNERAPDIRQFRSDVPPRVAAAIDRALQKDPARRFPTMRAFADELRACLAPPPSEGATQILPPPSPRAARPRARRRKRGPLGYIVLAVLIGLAVLVAVLALGGETGGSPQGSTAVHLHGVTSYDPVGQEAQIFGYTAPRATDGEPTTAWLTQTYATTAFGRLKDGIGLVLSSPSTVALKSLVVTTSTPGFVAEVKAGSSPSGGGGWVVDSASQTVGTKTTFTLNGESGSYWLVWITQLGPARTAAIESVTAKK